MTLNIQKAASKANLGSQNIKALTRDDLHLVKSAVEHIFKHRLANGTGIDQHDLAVFSFDAHKSINPYAKLRRCAEMVCENRLYYTLEDTRLLREYKHLMENKMMDEGRVQVTDELDRNVMQAIDEYGSPDDASSVVPTTHESLLSHQSRTSLASLLSLSGVQEFVQTGDFTRLPEEARNRVIERMVNDPDRYSVAGSSRGCDMFARLPQLPALPAFAEIGNLGAIRRLDEAEALISQRLRDESEVMLWLVRNRGILWRLKMRRSELRAQGKETEYSVNA